MKFPEILQSILYFIGYLKSEINIKNTNILDWKNVKELIKDDKLFWFKISNYNHQGAKSANVISYAKTNSLTKKMDKYNVEDVENFNIGYGRLFRWFSMNLKLRKVNIEIRRENLENLKVIRQEIMERNQEKMENKVKALEDFRESLNEEELETFNEEEWNLEYDEKNPLEKVPEEVFDEEDNDFDFDE